MATTILAKN